MSKSAQYWLVKSEPEAYSWENLVKDGKTAWTGVRNFQARNNLRAMKEGDAVLFYHSVSDKEVVGISRVVATAYPDPTAKEDGWDCVDLAPDQPLAHPVTLESIKTNEKLKEIALLRQSRLSVMPLTAAEFKEIVRMGKA